MPIWPLTCRFLSIGFVVHAVVIAALVLLLPAVLGAALYLFAEDHPRNDDDGDAGGELPQAAL